MSRPIIRRLLAFCIALALGACITAKSWADEDDQPPADDQSSQVQPDDEQAAADEQSGKAQSDDDQANLDGDADLSPQQQEAIQEAEQAVQKAEPEAQRLCAQGESVACGAESVLQDLQKGDYFAPRRAADAVERNAARNESINSTSQDPVEQLEIDSARQHIYIPPKLDGAGQNNNGAFPDSLGNPSSPPNPSYPSATPPPSNPPLTIAAYQTELGPAKIDHDLPNPLTGGTIHIPKGYTLYGDASTGEATVILYSVANNAPINSHYPNTPDGCREFGVGNMSEACWIARANQIAEKNAALVKADAEVAERAANAQRPDAQQCMAKGGFVGGGQDGSVPTCIFADGSSQPLRR